MNQTQEQLMEAIMRLSILSKSGQYFYEVIGNIHDNKLEAFERK